MRKPTKKYPRSPAYRIFHTQWSLRTHRLNLQTEEEINNFGIRMSGDRRVTEAHLMGVIDVAITIADMVRIRRLGGDLWLKHPANHIIIYDIIQHHLRNWVEVLNTYDTTAQDACPLEDLRDLNDLALLMLSRANRHYEREDLDDLVTAAKNRMAGLDSSAKPTRRLPRFFRPEANHRIDAEGLDDLPTGTYVDDKETIVLEDPHPLVDRHTYEQYKRKSRLDSGLFEALERLTNERR